MKKKYFLILLPALLLALVLLWPHAFPELTAGKEITLTRIDMPTPTGEGGNTYTSASTAYSTRTLVQTIMDRYYFRFCPLRTLLANGTMEDNDAGYWIHIYGNGSYLSTGGTGYVMVDGRIYHVGLFGNSANLALMEDLSAVITNGSSVPEPEAQQTAEGLAKDEKPEDAESKADSYDFDHDGVPETAEVVKHFDEALRYTWFELQVKRADGTILWKDEAHTAHSGYNSLFACRVDGKDYLLQYRPTMYQGNCDYAYRLFSLDAQGGILTHREANASFDINWGTTFHSKFHAAEFADFMDEVNGLLTNSKLLLNTDTALDDIDPENPQDIPWWLRDQEICAGYVYDESKTLRDNLLALERVVHGDTTVIIVGTETSKDA